MGKRKLSFNEKSLRRFIVRQAALIVGLIVAASILSVIKTTANTLSADTVVESVADQFSGKTSKLEMDVSVKSADSFSGVVSAVAISIIAVLSILLVLDLIPVIRGMLKKLNARSKK
jgi:beta-lactamase regulating signal transducer with metallopeptidase domain